MSDDTETLAEVLAAHAYQIEQGGSGLCACGWPATRRGIQTDLQTAHRSHLAEALAARIVQARAGEVDRDNPKPTWLALWERLRAAEYEAAQARAGEGALRERVFIEALGEESGKYAVNRQSPSGPLVWSLTLAQLPEIALTAFRAALTETTGDPT